MALIGKCCSAMLLPLLIAGTQVSHARPARQADEDRLRQCIYEASKGQPWLERTLWALRDQEAGWIGAELRNSNGSSDLGPLQINSFWIPKLAAMIHRPPEKVRSWLIHDPCFNVQAARWIFVSALLVTRDYWKAVGVYHSPTRWRQLRYASLVAAHLKRRFGAAAFSD